MRAFIYRITCLLLFAISISATSLAQTISPNIPQCGFDGILEIERQSDPAIEDQCKWFLEEAIPAMSGQDRNSLEPLMTISVVVHVIHSGEPVGQGSNISDERILAQMAVLNQDYCALNAKYYDTPSQWFDLAGIPNIQFLLAETDPFGDPTNGITRHDIPVTGTSWNNNNINSEIKPMVNWDPEKYMNIYVVSIPGTTSSGGVVGYSNYPLISQIGTDRDGPVVDYNWFGGPGFGASGFRALSHETGHYLGLPHTFNGSSCNSDDSIADTPNIDDATNAYVTLDCESSFPVGPTSCGSEHLYVNYMDYTTENCYTSFTQGQINVMRSVLDGTSSGFGYGSREELVNNAPGQTFIPFNDAGITRLISPDIINCTPDSLSPTVTLRNFGSADLNSVTIKYFVNGGQETSYSWTGNLFPGELINVNLPAYAAPDGGYFFECYTEMPNGVVDNSIENDTLLTGVFTYFAFDPPMVETVEGEIDFPTQYGTFEFNVTNDDFTWEVTNEVSGYGFGEDCFVFNNRAGDLINNPGGSLDALITRHFDFTAINGAALYFDVAYAPYSSLQNDTLIVLISTNCTQNFNQIVYVNGGQSLATAPATQTTFTPLPLQWRTDGVDLSSYDGMDDVAVAFLNVSGWGNRLFIDNIRIGTNCAELTAEWDITADGCGNLPGSCTGAASVNVPVSNGNLNYQWSGFPTNYNEPFADELCAGEVSVTITDAFGCQIVSTEEIPGSQGPALQVSSTDVTTYNVADGTATVAIENGNPPYTFTWNTGVVAMSSFPMYTLSGLEEGTYTVDVVDADGCTSSATIEVGSVCTGFSTSTFTWDVSCYGEFDGAALVNTSNGTAPYNYEWSNGATSQLVITLPEGTHTVTVTDVNQCPAVDTVLIQQPDLLEVSTTHTNESGLNANDGTATANAIGGTPNYSYNWSNGATTQTVQGLAPGIYGVTVTDSNGCQEIGLVSIQSFSCDAFGATVSWTDVSCNGLADGVANLIVSGETQPLTINWSNGSTDIFVQDLAPATYTVTVTDAAGCSSELSTIITEPSALTLSISSTAETTNGGNDGTATVTPSGGTPYPIDIYEYEWSSGATTQDIAGLAPGNYSVTVTDMNGCTASSDIDVEASDCTLSIQMTVENATCPMSSDGTATVDNVPGGNAPFLYNWSNGQTTQTAVDLAAGNYFVTVTDADGCTVSGWVMLGDEDVTPPAINVTTSVLLEIQANSIEFNVWLIDNGSFDNCSTVTLSASKTLFDCSEVGDHVVEITATDEAGNTSSIDITVTVVDNGLPIVTCPLNYSSTDCGPVSYNSPIAIDNCSVIDLSIIEGQGSGEVFPVGTTEVVWQAVDPSGNVGTCSFEVNIESDLAIIVQSITPATGGEMNGLIEFEINGGTPPYQTVWFLNGIEIPGFDPDHVLAGTYSLQVTDGNGCTIEENSIVVENISATNDQSLGSQINIFPNPTTGIVQIEFVNSKHEISKIELINLAGSSVYAKTTFAEGNLQLIDLSQQPKGVYWVRIQTEAGVVWKKLILI